MNSLDAYENDIHLQPDFVNSFQLQDQIPIQEQPETIFAGSGDSLVASMLAESFSGSLVRAMDPLDLYRSRSLLEQKRVYFVSVSGNTTYNIRSARIAASSVAVTSNYNSRLARICKNTIHLNFPSSGIFTAGSASFLASALTCISLVSRFSLPDSKQIFARAEAAARSTGRPDKVFILGNLHTYPLTMYCAAKFYEVLGADAHYGRIEQFSHMELFSARKGDTVIIFDGPTAHNRRLAGHLRSAGIDVVIPGPWPKNRITSTLFLVFYSQLLPLYVARDSKQSDCYFVLAKKLRSASNSMIYS